MVGDDFYIMRPDGQLWLGSVHDDDTKNWTEKESSLLPLGFGIKAAKVRIAATPEYFSNCVVFSKETTK